LHRLRENTDEGSRLAQYLLGVMYQLNEIVPQDYAEAAKWVHRAAEQGLAVAQFVLGENLRAREGECELGTLAIGKRCQENFGDRMGVVADSSRNLLSTRSMWRATGGESTS
jgi:TPR repeat protein